MDLSDTHCMQGRDTRVTPFGRDFDPNIKIPFLPNRWKSEGGAIGISHFTYRQGLEIWFKSGHIRGTYLPHRRALQIRPLHVEKEDTRKVPAPLWSR